MTWPFYTTFQTSNKITDQRREGNLNNTKTFKFLVFLSYPVWSVIKHWEQSDELLHFIGALN